MAKTVGKINNIVLRDLMATLVRQVYYFSQDKEFIIAIEALSTNFKSTIYTITWSKALIVFKPVFVATLHLLMRKDIIDEKSLKRKDLFGDLVDLINEAISFTSIKFDNLGELQVSMLWREYFLRRSNSDVAKLRIKRFWLILVDCWRNKHPVKFLDSQEILDKFAD